MKKSIKRYVILAITAFLFILLSQWSGSVHPILMADGEKNEAVYPKKLQGNPVESSGLPNKTITDLQIWNEAGKDYCYIGYSTKGNLGPVWILKHKPYPCKFIIEDLINEEGISRFCVIDNGSEENLYIPGWDPYEQRPPSLAVNDQYTIVGRRDTETGNFYATPFQNSNFINHSVTDPTESLYDVDPKKSSFLSIALNNNNQCIAFHTVSGILYYRFGRINSGTTPSITWEGAVAVPGNIRLERLSLSMNKNGKFVLAYRYFYKLNFLVGDIDFDNKEINNYENFPLGLIGKEISVSLNDNGYCILVYQVKLNKNDVIKTICRSLTAKSTFTGNTMSNTEVAGSFPSVVMDKDKNCVLCVKIGSNLSYYSSKITKGDINWGTATEYANDSTRPSIALMGGSGNCIEMHKSVSPSSQEFEYIYGDFIHKGVNASTSAYPYKEVNPEWDLGNFYKHEESTREWNKYRTIPNGVHNYDMDSYNSKLFAALGTEVTNREKIYALQYSDDDGENWSTAADNAHYRYHNLFKMDGKLFATSNDLDVYQFDSTTSQFVLTSKNLAPDITLNSISRVTQVTDDVVLYIANKQYVYKLQPGENGQRVPLPYDHVKPQDIVVLNNYVYILSSMNVESAKNCPSVGRSASDDLQKWQPYGSEITGWHNKWNGATPTALAVRAATGNMYIGADDGSIWIDLGNSGNDKTAEDKKKK